jgi:hypothetical protein
MRGRSFWESSFVVSDDFVRSAGIQNGQLIDAVKNVFQLAYDDMTSPLLAEALKTFFQGLLDGCS